ncbi:MAG: hypothetical protein ABIJ08_07345 [Nanoarchaeota archaeon]
MEHREHHFRELKFLIAFNIVFFTVFVIALLNIWNGNSVFGLNLPYNLDNWIVLVFSFFSIIKVFWNLLLH